MPVTELGVETHQGGAEAAPGIGLGTYLLGHLLPGSWEARLGSKGQESPGLEEEQCTGSL